MSDISKQNAIAHMPQTDNEKSNVVSARDEVFESGGGSYIHFYPEDIERMKSMTVEEQIEYKAWLIGKGRYIE